MKRWQTLLQSPQAGQAQADGETSSGRGLSPVAMQPGSSGLGEQAEATGIQTMTSGPLEPNIRFANLKQKLALIRRDGKNTFNLEAMSDLVEEARFNKSAIVGDASAAVELIKLLAIPVVERRAMHLREITEFGRNIAFPSSWHGAERFRSVVWYHALQRLKLVEFREGETVMRPGPGTCCYWLLSGDIALRSPAVVEAQDRAAAADAVAQEASAKLACVPRFPGFGSHSMLRTARSGRGRQLDTSLGSGASRPGTRQQAQRTLRPRPSTKLPGPHPNRPPEGTDRSFSSRRTSLAEDVPFGRVGPSPSFSRAAATQMSFSRGAPFLAVGSNTSTPRSTMGTEGLAPPRGVACTPNSTSTATKTSPRTGQAHTPVEGGSGDDEYDQLNNALAAAAAAAEAATAAEFAYPDIPLSTWDIFGEAALQGEPYDKHAIALSDGVAACLTTEDYQAVLGRLAHETFESLYIVYVMLLHRAKRSSKELRDLADQLALFGLFKTMEPAMRREVCSLVEYIYCPAGFTLFEEGDKVDFCYMVLHGSVSFTRYDEKTRHQEDLGSKTTGDHFGTLLTLSAGEKKRPFTAVTTSICELAVISRVGYNRILKKQLQGAIAARVTLLKGLAVMRSSTAIALQKVAVQCQDEVFEPGSIIVDPSCPPDRIFFVMEGEAKLVWMTNHPDRLPPVDAQRQPTAAAWALAASGSFTDSHKPATPNAAAGTPAYGAASSAAGADRADRQGSIVSVNQQLGSSTFAQGTRLAPGRQRHMIEVARLAHGDLINGIVMTYIAPVFHVIAATHMRVLSLEADAVEGVVGRESCQMMQALASDGHAWALKRLHHAVTTRHMVEQHMMDASAQRSLPAQHLGKFKDHYVPPGVWELAEQQAAAEQPAGGATACTAPAGPTPAASHAAKDMMRVPMATVQSLSPENSAGRLSAPNSQGNLGAQRSCAQESDGLYGAQASSSYLSIGSGVAANAAQLAGLVGDDSNRGGSFGTAVGMGTTPRKKKNRHMAYAGGMSTSILDLTTEPSLGVPVGVERAAASPEASMILTDAEPSKVESQPQIQMLSIAPDPGARPLYPASPMQQPPVATSSASAVAALLLPSLSASPLPAMAASLRCDSDRSFDRLSNSAHTREQQQQQQREGKLALPASASLPSLPAASRGTETEDWQVAAIMKQASSASYYPQLFSESSQGQGATGHARRSTATSFGVCSPGAPTARRAVPHSPSPVLNSPALPGKVVVHAMSSIRECPVYVMRSAAVVSALISPDGTIDLHDQPLPTEGYERNRNSPLPGSQYPGTQEGEQGDGEPSFMIMPRMMNVYQSVLSPNTGIVQPLGLRRRRSPSPSKALWMPATKAEPASMLERKARRWPQQVADMPFLKAASSAQGGVTSPEAQQTGPMRPAAMAASVMGVTMSGFGMMPLASAFAMPVGENVNTTAPPSNVASENGTANRSDSMTGPYPALRSGSSVVLTRHMSRAFSRRLSMTGRTSFKGAEGVGEGPAVIRMIAQQKENEPCLPLDCDIMAPQLRDHKLSQPTLSDLNYIIHRWGNRWATERETQLHMRLVDGKQLPAGLTPRTLERVYDADPDDNPFNRPLTLLDTFGVPVQAAGV